MSEFYHYAFDNIKPLVVRSFGKAHQQSNDYQLSMNDKSVCRQSGCFEKELKRITRP